MRPHQCECISRLVSVTPRLLYFIHALLQGLLVYLWFQASQEVACHFETQPAGGHAGGDLEQVGYNALVEASDAFLANNDSDSVEDALVLVSHAGHGVDLETSSKDVTGQVSLTHTAWLIWCWD